MKNIQRYSQLSDGSMGKSDYGKYVRFEDVLNPLHDEAQVLELATRFIEARLKGLNGVPASQPHIMAEWYVRMAREVIKESAKK